MGTVYAVTPQGTSFATPVTVTLPIEAGKVPAGSTPALFKTNAQGQWELVGGAVVQGGSVVAPATATFAVVATGGSRTSYQWQRSNDGGATWAAVTDATLASVTTAATTLGDSGARLRVVITSAAGSSTSQAATLTVTAPPAVAGIRIAAGSGFSIAAPASGQVQAWGLAADGIATPDRVVPGPVLTATGVVSVAAGSAHALALKSDGTVLAWGYNDFGQLCNGTFDPPPRGLPFPANAVTNVIAIAAGSTHSVFLKADGTVWTAGRNHTGQLGDGTLPDGTFPPSRNLSRQVQGLTGISAIAAGGNHTLALKSDGTVWAWGENINGQLGDGGSTNSGVPLKVAGLSSVMRIAAGGQFSLALVRENPRDTFGSLWGWGLNNRDQLGTTVSRELLLRAELTLRAPLAEIAAGYAHSLLLYFDGTVFASGDNQSGQLGVPAFGGDCADTPRWVSGLPSNVVAISAGSGHGHSLAQAANGSVGPGATTGPANSAAAAKAASRRRRSP